MTASRTTPLSGNGATYVGRVKEEVEALAQFSNCPLTSLAGVNTITATALYALDMNRAGQKFSFLPPAPNTGNVTLNIDGKGALPVRDASGNELPAGYFSTLRLETVINMGTEFRLTMNPGSSGGPTLLRAVFAYTKTSGVNGGANVGGSVRTRYPFNTVISNTIPGMTLDAATNIGRISAPARAYGNVFAAMLILRNISDAADVPGCVGPSMYCNSGGTVSLFGKATFAATKSLDLQYATANGTANGLGNAVGESGGTAEIYGVIEFTSYG